MCPQLATVLGVSSRFASSPPPLPGSPAPPRPPALTAGSVSPQAPDEAALTTLAETLKQHGVDHEVWTEQPENVATCLALRPYPKDQVHQHLKKFKLLK